ncbi:MAG: alginate export family protein [Cytophagaceae bacterium]
MNLSKTTIMKGALLILAAGWSTLASAQLSITGQYRTRSEFRYGQGTLPYDGVIPSFFISQRMRLNFGLTGDKYRFFAAIQDVRVWGQDASTINQIDGNKLGVHEAWGEVILNDTTTLKSFSNFSIKAGRQALVYDDQRLLGGLDWLQQGRRHDAIVLKTHYRTWKFDAGFAFNQTREIKNNGTNYYPIPVTVTGTDGANIAAPAGTNGITNMYKAMQYVYLSKEIGYSKLAFLFFNDAFQKNKGGAGAFTPTRGVWSRQTFGLSYYGQIKRTHKIDAGVYYQGNKDRTGKTMDAYMAFLQTDFQLGRKFNIGPGVDFLSGNNTLDSTSTVNRAFDPLYGTPHKFWGYMDYFYVADPFNQTTGGIARVPGLLNFNLTARYKFSDKTSLYVAAHQFLAANKVANRSTADLTDKMSSNLGTEIDMVLNYNLTKMVGFELGYSVMFATETMAAIKPVAGITNNAEKDLTAHWAYFSINIRPDFTQAINTQLRELRRDLDAANKSLKEIQDAQVK